MDVWIVGGVVVGVGRIDVGKVGGVAGGVVRVGLIVGKLVVVGIKSLGCPFLRVGASDFSTDASK